MIKCINCDDYRVVEGEKYARCHRTISESKGNAPCELDEEEGEEEEDDPFS